MLSVMIVGTTDGRTPNAAQSNLHRFLGDKLDNYDVTLKVEKQIGNPAKSIVQYYRIVRMDKDYVVCVSKNRQNVHGKLGHEKFYQVSNNENIYGVFNRRPWSMELGNRGEEIIVMFDVRGMNLARRGKAYDPQAKSKARWIESFGWHFLRKSIKWSNKNEISATTVAFPKPNRKRLSISLFEADKNISGLRRALANGAIMKEVRVLQWNVYDKGRLFPKKYTFAVKKKNEIMAEGKVEIVRAAMRPVSKAWLAYKRFYEDRGRNVKVLARTENHEARELLVDGNRIAHLGDYLVKAGNFRIVTVVAICIAVAALPTIILVRMKWKP